MQQYELFLVFPGTLTEEEVAPIAAKVQETLEKQGATGVAIHDMGKSRLAYPMNHIRYGFFRLCYFSAEPRQVPEIEAKLRLVNQILRVIVRVHNPKAGAKQLQQILSDVAIATEIEERRGTAERTSSEVIHTISHTKPDAPKEERKTEAVPLADIDKKLDELLGGDLANV